MAESVAAATPATTGRFRAGWLEPRLVELTAGAAATAGSVVAVVLAVRLPLTVDEAAIVASSGGDLRGTLERALEHDPGQTAYRALLHPLIAADAPDWVLRAPSLVAAAAAAGVVRHVARALAGRAAGMAAAVVVLLAAIATEAASSARPHALALLAAAVATWLFVRARGGRGGAWWVIWGFAACLLPLVHPLCVAVVAAHLLALLAEPGSLPRVAMPAAAVAAVVSGLFAAAAAVERGDASGGDGVARVLGEGAARAGGWSPAAAALAVAGAALLVRGAARWEASLVVALAVAPVLALGVAASILPVSVGNAALVATPGIALAVGVACGAIADARLASLALAAACAGALVAVGVVTARGADADWRAAAHWVADESGPRESVVVSPPRARAAFVRYAAPGQRVLATGRGDGVWVVVRATREPTAAGRGVVSTPRYALLERRSFGDELVVEHWVRP